MAENTYLTGVHYGLGDVRHQSLRNCIGNRCLNAPGTTLEAGDKNDIETGGTAITYTIDGIVYTKAALADENVACTDSYGDNPVQAADTTAYYALCLDASGTITAYKGQDDGAMPGHPADLCCFCLIKVVTVAVTFTLGTTDFDAAGVTSTFYDVSFLPSSAP